MDEVRDKKRKRLPRRDRCYLIGGRAARLSKAESARAWQFLALKLEEMAEKDIPKFEDVVRAVRLATIEGKGKN